MNAHVLVLKYGLDFSEYVRWSAHAEELREVTGAAPFVIHEMMFAKGDRLSNVLVKGVDPARLGRVLDLPSQMVKGSLDGLRLADQGPPRRERNRSHDPFDPEEDLNAYLLGLWNEPASVPEPSSAAPIPAPTPTRPAAPLPAARVPTPAEVEAALGTDVALPDDAAEAALFADAGPKLDPHKLLPGVVVGATLAENLGAQGGRRACASCRRWPASTPPSSAPIPARPSSLDFRVTGIFEAGFQEYDTRLVYVDLLRGPCAWSITATPSPASSCACRRLDDAPRIARQLEADLGGGPYHTMDWRELNHNLFTALEVQKVMLEPGDRHHHLRRGLQRHRHPDHGGAREEARDRHPQGHGRERLQHPHHLPGAGPHHRPGRHRHRPRARRRACWPT